MCDAFSVTANILAVAGFAAKSCQNLFQTLSRFSEGPEELRRHLAALHELQSIFANIVSLERDAVLAALLTPEFSSRLHSCMLDLRTMEELVQSFNIKPQDGKVRQAWYRIRWSLWDQKQILKSHLERIEYYQRTLSLDLLLLNTRLGIQIANGNPSEEACSHPSALSTAHNSYPTHSRGSIASYSSKSITHNSQCTISQDTIASYSFTPDKLSLRGSIWKSVQTNLLRFGICIGPIYAPQYKPSLGFNTGKPPRGHGVLFSSGLRQILPLRLDFMIFCLNNQNGRGLNFSLHCNLFFPRVVPYYSRIFDFVKLGDLNAVKEEFQRGQASPFDTLPSGDTLLHVASSKDFPDIISFLLQNGARVDVYNDYGETPLHRAVAISKSFDVCRLLLDHGSDLWSCNLDGQTPLHTFTSPVTEQILQSQSSEIDFSMPDNRGMTLLHYLAWSSKTTPETFHRYRKHSSLDLYAGNTSSYSPLQLATQRGNISLVTYFLETSEIKHTQVETPDYRGRTLLHYAVESKRAAETINLLFSYLNDLNIHTRDAIGRSALHHAVYHGNIGAVKALFNQGMGAMEELEVLDHGGLTPLGIARDTNDKVLTALLEDIGSGLRC